MPTRKRKSKHIQSSSEPKRARVSNHPQPRSSKPGTPRNTVMLDRATNLNEIPSEIRTEKSLITFDQNWAYDPILNMIGPVKELERLNLEQIARDKQASADQINSVGLTLVWDYFATGEGRRVCYLRTELDEVQAREAFRKRFFANLADQDWMWIADGLEVHRGTFWPDFLNGYRTPPDSLEMHWYSQL